jgi:hypothetical protein
LAWINWLEGWLLYHLGQEKMLKLQFLHKMKNLKKLLMPVLSLLVREILLKK